MSQQISDTMFSKIDEAGTSSVTLTEFINFFERLMSSSNDEKFKVLMAQYCKAAASGKKERIAGHFSANDWGSS